MKKLPVNIQDGIDFLEDGLDRIYFVLISAIDYNMNEHCRNLIESAIDSYEVTKKNAAKELGKKEYKIGLRTYKIKEDE